MASIHIHLGSGQLARETVRTWGVCFGPAWGTSVGELIDPARAAEAAGFDRVATGEFRNDAITWAGVLAAATREIPVATTIASVALRHPSVVGEAAAALRDVYGARIELGLGVSHPTLVCDDLGLRQPNLGDLEAYVATVRAVIAGTAIAEGRYRVPVHQRRRLETAPPPIYVSALGETAARRAARYADGVILTWSPVEWTRRIAAAVREEDATTGHATKIWVVVPTFPNHDLHTAREACTRHLRPYLDLPSYRKMLAAASGDPDRISRATSPDTSIRDATAILGADLIDSVSAAGDRTAVTAAIEATSDAGADAVILYPLDTGAGWREAVDTTIRRLAPQE